MATEGAAPPTPSRTRLYSVILVVVTAVVVTLAILLPLIYEQPSPPPTPSPGVNVEVDQYAAGSPWAGEYGDDPAVAVAPNGTIAMAWEGLDELAPPTVPGGLPTFATQVFVSYSYDAGVQYSAPLAVGGLNATSAFEPSLVYAPNGTLFLAYANATATEDQQVLVFAAPPGEPFGAGTIAVAGQSLARPMLFALPQGIVGLAFMYSEFVEWTTSTNGAQSFGAPTILLEGILTGGTVWKGDEVTLVGLEAGAVSGTTVSLWSITLNASDPRSSVTGTPATIQMPYPDSISLPNLSRPGPAVTAAGGLLYLVYSSENETELTLATSSTNGSTWAGPFDLWSGHNLSVETPGVETSPTGSTLVISWQSTAGGLWKTYAALFSVRTGLLSAPASVSSAPGFPASVRNWHGTSIGLAIQAGGRFVVAWGDGRGLTGVYGLTHIVACTVTAAIS